MCLCCVLYVYHWGYQYIGRNVETDSVFFPQVLESEKDLDGSEFVHGTAELLILNPQMTLGSKKLVTDCIDEYVYRFQYMSLNLLERAAVQMIHC